MEICKERVRPDLWSSERDCGNKAKNMRSGRLMCGIHSRAMDKRREAAERYREKENQKRHIREMHVARKQLVEFLADHLNNGAQSVSFSALATDDETTTLRDLVDSALGILRN